jgi:hypothetical protein
VSDIKQLPHPAPDEAVIVRIEKMLAEAKDGSLRAFVAATVHHTPGFKEGGVAHFSAGKTSVGHLVWALERAKLKLMGFVEDIDIGLDSTGP